MDHARHPSFATVIFLLLWHYRHSGHRPLLGDGPVYICLLYTSILTTHYMEEAQSLCDRIAVMARGRLRAVGTVGELMAQTKAPNFEEAFVSLCEKEESL